MLETIPGIHVSYANGFLPTYVIRGVGSSTNSPVLIYLDGIPINSSVVSTSHFSLSHLAKNVEKIEILNSSNKCIGYKMLLDSLSKLNLYKKIKFWVYF